MPASQPRLATRPAAPAAQPYFITAKRSTPLPQRRPQCDPSPCLPPAGPPHAAASARTISVYLLIRSIKCSHPTAPWHPQADRMRPGHAQSLFQGASQQPSPASLHLFAHGASRSTWPRPHSCHPWVRTVQERQIIPLGLRPRLCSLARRDRESEPVRALSLRRRTAPAFTRPPRAGCTVPPIPRPGCGRVLSAVPVRGMH
ncbi:MAG: hypothetical protein J3K34DRAFT_430179, partial [Monoraphidium minutum]